MRIRAALDINILKDKINESNLKKESELKEMLFLYFLNFGNFSGHSYRKATDFEDVISKSFKENMFIESFDKEFIKQNIKCLPHNVIEQLVSERTDKFLDILKQVL